MTLENSPRKMEKKNKNYVIVKKIASGAFGEIHSAIDKETGRKLAIKIERNVEHGQLRNEYKVYKEFKRDCKPFIPNIYGYGTMVFEKQGANGLILDLLGPSLETLFKRCDHKFSLKTVLKLGEHMVDIIDYIHSKGLIHRDIKPENFVLDDGQFNFTRIYIVDFGLAKLYRNPNTFWHIPCCTGKSLTGTARYASLNCHLGLEQSRRDDLESMIYCLIYFSKGKLPWQGVPGANKQEKFTKIRKIKETLPINQICEGVNPVFSKILYYVRSLTFDELPSYLYIKTVLKRAFIEENLVDDGMYDWNYLKDLNSGF